MSIEETPITSDLQTFIPMDRRVALVNGERLPDRTVGAALFADISGFTPLTRTLLHELGPRRGAEEILRQINPVYDALIDELHRYGGSVIVFAGDSITCWLDGDEGRRAVMCALAMQAAMAQFTTVHSPAGTPISMAVKISVAVGAVRRFVVGDPAIQLIDALAGETLDKMAAGEQLAERGEVLVGETAVSALNNNIIIDEWRVDENGRRFAAITAITDSPIAPAEGWPTTLSLPDNITRDWMLPAICERIVGGSGFLAELRPAASLFLQFGGLDFDSDDAAGAKLDAFTQWAQRILHKYEGYLLQMPIGDKGSYFAASFGAPIAHDDDAARAVAAALDLLQLPDELGFITAVKIGISQGLMWAGAIGADARHTYAVMGDQTNMAARLMGKAENGQILISKTIADDAAESYRLQSLGAMVMKGSDAPMEVYSVIGRQQRSQEMAQYVHPLVGREQELMQLQTIAERAIAGEGQIVHIEGGAGTGKSHLAADFAQRATAQGVYVATGACESISQETAYTPWRQIFRTILGVTAYEDALDAAEQITQLEQTLHYFNPEWELRLPLLGDLLGLPIEDNPTTAAFDPSLRQQALFSLLVEVVQLWSQEQPLLLLVEDIQWMDEASQALTVALARAIGSHAVMLLMLKRPLESDTTIMPDIDELAYTQTMRLDELSNVGMAALIEGRLGKKPTGLLVSLIAEKAHGNPFFIEELLETLEEMGQIAPRPDGTISISDETFDALRRANLVIPEGDEWALVEGADLTAVSLNIPNSIHGTVLSRIDRLPEPHKLTLKVASVIGRRFDFDLLHPSHPRQPDENELQQETAEMLARDFINVAEPPPHLAYLFRHNTTHEVTYETLLYAQRKRLHRVVADALEALQPDLIDQLAYHTFIAEEWERALAYHLQAGEKAKQLFANHQAIEHFNRALQCAEAMAEKETAVLQTGGSQTGGSQTATQRQTIHLALGELLTSVGQYDAAREHLTSALSLAEARADGDAQANACRWFARSYELQGEFPPALEWIDRGLEIKNIKKTAIGAELIINAGVINTRQGEYEKAITLGQQSLEIAKNEQESSVLARSYGLLGMVVYTQGRNEEAIQFIEKSLQLYAQADNTRGKAIAQNQLATVYFDRGQLQEADHFYRQAKDTFIQVGDIYNSVIADNNLGGIARNQGRLEDALQFYFQALHALETIGGSLWVFGVLHMNLAHTFIRKQNIQKSTLYLDSSLSYFKKANSKGFLPELYRLYAQMYLLEDNLDAVVKYGHQALNLARKLHMKGEEGICLSVLGDLYITLNQHETARSKLLMSANILKDIGDEYEWARTQVIYARLCIAEKNFKTALTQLEFATAVFKKLEAKLDLATIDALQKEIEAGKSL